jgi:hypothetical protein
MRARFETLITSSHPVPAANASLTLNFKPLNFKPSNLSLPLYREKIPHYRIIVLLHRGYRRGEHQLFLLLREIKIGFICRKKEDFALRHEEKNEALLRE